MNRRQQGEAPASFTLHRGQQQQQRTYARTLSRVKKIYISGDSDRIGRVTSGIQSTADLLLLQHRRSRTDINLIECVFLSCL